METKAPPYSLEAEQSLLGGLMFRNDLWPDIDGEVTAEDFYREDHRLIFGAIAALIDNRKAADVLTVRAKLLADHPERGDLMTYLAEIANNCPSYKNIGTYAAIVREKSELRALIGVGLTITEAGYNPGEQTAAQVLDAAQAALAKGGKDCGVTYGDVMASVLTRIEMRGRGELQGLKSGIDRLDAKTTGHYGGELIIVGARPGMGKTAFGLGVADHVAANGHSVLMFELEMPAEQVVHRSLAGLTGIDVQRLRAGNMNDEEYASVVGASAKLMNYGLTIDDQSGLHIRQIKYRARRRHRKSPLSLIVVDYLQLVQGDGDNRNQQIGHITRELKGLAKELDIPIMVLSQLSRECEKRGNKRPIMADLRESGEIEQDADLILFLYRHEVYEPKLKHWHGIGEIIIGKARSGPTGTAYACWRAHCAKYGNLPNGWQPPEQEEQPARAPSFAFTKDAA